MTLTDVLTACAEVIFRVKWIEYRQQMVSILVFISGDPPDLFITSDTVS